MITAITSMSVNPFSLLKSCIVLTDSSSSILGILSKTPLSSLTI
jgi:hypothetical protein